jgi:transposase
VVVRRKCHLRLLRRYSTAKLVFLDESSAKTNMTRLYGRAPIEERCHFAQPHGHWRTQTMLSALRTTGPIKSATLVLDGPINGTAFCYYITHMLAPALTPGDVVIMDNLSAHRVTGVRESLESKDITLHYLPPYSPDLNPIEKMWSKIKSLLRSAGARTTRSLYQAVGNAFRAVTSQECLNYFKSCGYAT